MWDAGVRGVGCGMRYDGWDTRGVGWIDVEKHTRGEGREEKLRDVGWVDG